MAFRNYIGNGVGNSYDVPDNGIVTGVTVAGVAVPFTFSYPNGKLVLPNSTPAVGALVAVAYTPGASQNPVPFQTDIPLIIAPTGSFANNGVLTSGTANPATYLKTYTWFPAGAIVAAGAAGWYYTEWSTTTAAIVYNNVWDGVSEPLVPATKVAFVTTGPGAFTGPTTEAAYITVNQPAANPFSRFRFNADFAMTNNAGAKVCNLRMNTVAGTVMSASTLTSFAHARTEATIANTGVADKQRVFSETTTAAAVARSTPALQAETLSTSFAFAICVSKATATDVVVIERVVLEQLR